MSQAGVIKMKPAALKVISFKMKTRTLLDLREVALQITTTQHFSQ